MMTKSKLDVWISQAEKLEVAKNLIYFKQGAGLKYEKRDIDLLEQKSLVHAKEFLKNFGRKPRPLFLMSVDDIGNAKTYRYYLKFYDARISRIASRKFMINGKPVNWGSWRQFAAKTEDSSSRKELFDDFLSKARFLTPLIKSRFDGYADVLKNTISNHFLTILSLKI